jgi:hypothetical protein
VTDQVEVEEILQTEDVNGHVGGEGELLVCTPRAVSVHEARLGLFTIKH